MVSEVWLRANWISALLYRRRISMKQLTKEQLIDLVFNKCAVIVQSNAEQIKEGILNNIKGTEDDWNKMIVAFAIAYGDEIKREYCQTFAEILYDILYSE